MTQLPPPGWYDDPTSDGNERWWDGQRWSEQTRPKAGPEPHHTPGDLRLLGDYLGHAFELIRKRWDDFLLIAVLGAVISALLAVAFIRPVIDAVDITADEVTGFGSTQAWQLGIFGVLSVLVGAVLSLAQYKVAWSAATDETGGWATALQAAIANALRLIGWMTLFALPLLILIGVTVAAAAAESRLGALLFVGSVVAAVWWAVVAGFIPIAIIARPRDANPIQAALGTTRGRWWRILGRYIVMGIIVGIVTNVVTAIAGQFVTSGFFGLEFVVDDNGELDVIKNLGNDLEFFIGALVFTFVSYAANVATFSGITSIAYDAMPGLTPHDPFDDLI